MNALINCFMTEPSGNGPRPQAGASPFNGELQAFDDSTSPASQSFTFRWQGHADSFVTDGQTGQKCTRTLRTIVAVTNK
jgi:hypothetical protein